MLGNLVNRTITMVNKYFDGKINAPVEKEPLDEELIGLALETPKKVRRKMEELKVTDAIDEILVLLRRSNKYIDETMPWVLGKDESKKDRLATVLYNLIEAIRFSAVLLSPFIPEAAERILGQLHSKNDTWESLSSFDGTLVGGSVGTAKILFERIDIPKKLKELEGLIEDNNEKSSLKDDKDKKDNKEETNKPESNNITIDDFEKIDLRVGEIMECKKHPKAEKLLVSQVKIGEEVRQIVSGVAAYYTPSEMVGKKVIVVANLTPIKLRGEESKGMILFADNGEGLEFVLTDAPSGEKVR